MENVRKAKYIIRRVKNASTKPFIIVSGKKIFIKNKSAMYGPKGGELVKYLTTNLKAKEM